MISQEQDTVTQKYDGEAHHYDQARSNLFFDVAGETVSRMAAACRARSILDAPVGTGRIIPYILRNQTTVETYVCMDIAPAMLAVARERREQIPCRDAQFVLGDVWNMPFANDSFDLVLVLRLFHLFPDSTYAAAIKEVHRVLRPGGTLIAEVRNRYRGGVIGFLKQYADERNPSELKHHYVQPWQLKRVFSPLKITECRGIWLDGLQCAKYLSKSAFAYLHGRLNGSPLCYLTKELVVKAVKQPTDSSNS